jgi:hypothetical protein
MGLIENMLKGSLATNVAIGIAAAVVAPVVIPVVARAAKPVAKAAIKGGLCVYRSGRAGLSSAGGYFSGLLSEAKGEMEQEEKDRASGLDHAPPPCGPAVVPESPL